MSPQWDLSRAHYKNERKISVIFNGVLQDTPRHSGFAKIVCSNFLEERWGRKANFAESGPSSFRVSCMWRILTLRPERKKLEVSLFTISQHSPIHSTPPPRSGFFPSSLSCSAILVVRYDGYSTQLLLVSLSRGASVMISVEGGSEAELWMGVSLYNCDPNRTNAQLVRQLSSNWTCLSMTLLRICATQAPTRLHHEFLKNSSPMYIYIYIYTHL